MRAFAKSKRSNIELYNELNRAHKLVSIQDDGRLPQLSRRLSEGKQADAGQPAATARRRAQFPAGLEQVVTLEASRHSSEEKKVKFGLLNVSESLQTRI